MDRSSRRSSSSKRNQDPSSNHHHDRQQQEEEEEEEEEGGSPLRSLRPRRRSTTMTATSTATTTMSTQRRMTTNTHQQRKRSSSLPGEPTTTSSSSVTLRTNATTTNTTTRLENPLSSQRGLPQGLPSPRRSKRIKRDLSIVIDNNDMDNDHDPNPSVDSSRHYQGGGGPKTRSQQKQAQQQQQQPKNKNDKDYNDKKNIKVKSSMPLVTPSPLPMVEMTTPKTLWSTLTAFPFTNKTNQKPKKTKARLILMEKLPKGVVNLYPSQQHHQPVFPSATSPSSSSSSSPPLPLPPSSSVCSSRALSTAFILSYGKEYYRHMKESERPIVLMASNTTNPYSTTTSSGIANRITSTTSTSRHGVIATNNNMVSRDHSSEPLQQSDDDDDSDNESSPPRSQEMTTVMAMTPGRRRGGGWGHGRTTTTNHLGVGGGIGRSIAAGVAPVVPTSATTTTTISTSAIESSLFLEYQPDLTPKMRAILMDWIIELSEHFNFGPSTLHLACTLTDQVLACGSKTLFEEEERKDRKRKAMMRKQQKKILLAYDAYDDDDDDDDDEYDDDFDDEDDDDDDYGNDMESKTNCFLISRDRFQLLGATCTWLACKMEELKPPQVSQIAYVSDNIYSVEQIKRMERRVCNALGFAMARQTPYLFLHEFLRASQELTDPSWEIHESFQYFVLYLLELGRLAYLPVTKSPSMLTAAVIYLARGTFHMTPLWTPTLEYYTGYKAIDLKEVVLAVYSHQLAAEQSNLKSCFAKYKNKKYNRVALKTAPRMEDLGF